ncbi:MAG: 4-hydroxy-3-methylbut-2-enyl diphosphate reductase, partial [Ruminococcaceae bacterium]|nr:4-hydroxy-3-methylbut-2-enyl diphosphate reductase [Oscillospiraceae bacterium]
MLKVSVAETAGFCFGVARALDIVYNCAQSKDKKYCTLGPIIHNNKVVSELCELGVRCISDANEADADEIVIVRTHGIAKAICDEMNEKGIEFLDVTCPFVKKIHNIVKKHYDEGKEIIIIGDKTHPEVIGINGWCGNSAVIIENEEQAECFQGTENEVCVVAQTTFDKNILKKITFFLKKTCQKAIIFDTICNATEERQAEARELAAKVDVMIVLGGRNSSNSQKLYDISKSVCENTYFLESINDLENFDLFKNKSVGITAGASTPAVIIKEAINKMENQEQNFETLFEESLKTLN